MVNMPASKFRLALSDWLNELVFTSCSNKQILITQSKIRKKISDIIATVSATHQIVARLVEEWR